MSIFKKLLLLLAIVGGLNWLARTVFIVVGVAAICLIPSLFMDGESRPEPRAE